MERKLVATLCRNDGSIFKKLINGHVQRRLKDYVEKVILKMKELLYYYFIQNAVN